MMRILLLMATAMLFTACDDDKKKTSSSSSSTLTSTTEAGLNFRSTTGTGVTEDPADTFHIPACGAGKLGYITTRWTTPMSPGATMTVTFTVTASPDAKIEGAELRDAHEAGRAAMHFQRKNDTKTAKKDPYALDGKLYYKGYRQWSWSSEMLTPGDHTFSVVLTHNLWRGLTGDAEKDEANWLAAMADPAYAGITLSGAQSAGHGVCMAAGTASVTIKSLTVT